LIDIGVSIESFDTARNHGIETEHRIHSILGIETGEREEEEEEEDKVQTLHLCRVQPVE
jgi:hypothetical protein